MNFFTDLLQSILEGFGFAVGYVVLDAIFSRFHLYERISREEDEDEDEDDEDDESDEDDTPVSLHKISG